MSVEIIPAENKVPFFKIDRPLAREVLHLASPVVLGMASITAIGLTDTIMVGRLGAEALAATGQASIIFWAIHWVTRSIEVAAQALIARRYGEQQFHLCGKILDNAMTVSLSVSLLGMALLYFGGRTLMSWTSTHENVVDLASSYIQILCLALWASSLLFAMRGFFSGIGKTRIFLITALIMLVVNVICNYAFIFGKLGMPEMGVPGAALGSAISFIVALIYMVLYVLGISGRNFRKEFSVFRFDFDLTTVKEVIVLGAPNAFRGIWVIGGLGVFYAMVDRLNVIQVAIVNVVLNIQSVSFMPGYGFGVAAATLIGQSLGAKDPQRAERAGYEAAKLGMIFMGTLGIVFFVAPEWVVRLFTDDAEVIRSAIFPLRLAGIVQIADAAGMVFSTALEGAGNTRWVMKAEIFVNWGVFLPLTYFLTFVLELHQYGPWIAWSTYITLFGLLCIWKFREGKWKEIKL
ncbi:MATE family efflux transporter [bacterium]|nr:MAG: MATE family efflux transporter [bacterium]